MAKKIELLNGIIISYKNGRDGKVVEINVNGTKKKLSQSELENLSDSLIITKQWFMKYLSALVD